LGRTARERLAKLSLNPALSRRRISQVSAMYERSALLHLAYTPAHTGATGIGILLGSTRVFDVTKLARRNPAGPAAATRISTQAPSG